VLLEALPDHKLKFVLFGGKGGVGKTTCAAATAIHVAHSGLRTLLLSTDPAHSLSDSLNQALGNDVRPVKGVPNLHGLEISAEESLRAFREEHGSKLMLLLDTSTYLDDEDISALLGLTIPGIDEVMGLKRIMDLADSSRYDVHILDTAPTGHTLRLLCLPALFDQWIRMLAQMRWKYRYMVTRFAGSYRADEADKLLFDMKKTANQVRELLRDPAATQFVVVTNPDAMALAETERLVAELRRLKLPLGHMIVNNVLPSSAACPLCARRNAEQRRLLRRLRHLFREFDLTVVEMQPEQVRGLPRLQQFARLLFSANQAAAPVVSCAEMASARVRPIGAIAS